MKRNLFVIALFIPILLCGQNTALTEKVFPDGIYLNLEDLKSRKPTLDASAILINGEKTTHIKKWFRSDSLYYLNGQHKSTFLPYESVYAFVEDGILYIQRKGFDHKVTVAGSLCYFVESYPIRSAASTPVVMDRKNQTIPRILDLKKGELREYSTVTLAEILAERDVELYQEFTSITQPKKQRQLLLRFVERFNDRHPLTTLSQ